MGDILTNHNPKGYAIDVLLITHNKLVLTLQALDALYAHTQSPFHLIIVDDSKDYTPIILDGLMKEHDNITLLHSDEPYKTGNQMFNLGFEHCVTPFVATVMNSVRVEPDWEIHALELFEAYPNLGIIGFKCLFPDGLIESAGIMMRDAKIVDGGIYYQYTTQMPTDIGKGWAGHRASGTYDCDAVQWAFAMHRLEAVKGTIEDIFHGHKGMDDIDNCFAVKKKGWRIAYCGQGVAYHNPRATRGDDSAEAARLNQENKELFFKRWGFWRGDEKARKAQRRREKKAGGKD